MNPTASSLFFSIIILFFSGANGACKRKNSAVTDFGAVADGITDSSKAFMDAWAEACRTVGGAVVVPRGTYMVRGAEFKGPCNGPTLFSMRKSTIKASSEPILDEDFWIAFHQVDGLRVYGAGIFDGQGHSAWRRIKRLRSSFRQGSTVRPSSLKIKYVTNATIENIRLVDSKMFHLHIYESDGVTVRRLSISAPADSPNTDGIHLGKASNVKIVNTKIATGDDCVSMGDGCTNIDISGVRCGPGHGISIGSLGKYENERDVSGISVRNCTFSDTDNGLRIKTWAPSNSPSTVSNVTFENIRVRNVENPIVIDQYYCPDSSCQHNGESEVAIKGVRFVNVRGTSATEVAVNLQCSKENPCENIEFVGLALMVDGSGEPTTAACSNVEDKFDGQNQTPSGCS